MAIEDNPTVVIHSTPTWLVIRHPVGYRRGELGCIFFVLIPLFCLGIYLLIQAIANNALYQSNYPGIFTLVILPPLFIIGFSQYTYPYSFTVTRAGLTFEQRSLALGKNAMRIPRENFGAVLLDLYPTAKARILVQLESGATIPIFWDSGESVRSAVQKVSELWDMPYKVAFAKPPTFASIMDTRKQLTRRLRNMPPVAARKMMEEIKHKSEMVSHFGGYPAGSFRLVTVETDTRSFRVEEPGQPTHTHPMSEISEYRIMPIKEGERKVYSDDPDTFVYTYSLVAEFTSGARLILKTSECEEDKPTQNSTALQDATRIAEFLRSM